MAANTEATSPEGLVAAVSATHQQIKSLLNEVAAGDDRERSFERLASLLAAHESAENEVVHPLAARAEGGEGLVGQRLAEEHDGEEALKRLQQLGTEDPRFDDLFAKLREAVLQHAIREERDEHPILETLLSAEDSRRAASQFQAAQAVFA